MTTPATAGCRAQCCAAAQGDAQSKRARLWGPGGGGDGSGGRGGGSGGGGGGGGGGGPARASAPDVGPSQAGAGDEGRFRDLVRPTLVKPRPPADDKERQGGGGGVRNGERGGGSRGGGEAVGTGRDEGDCTGREEGPGSAGPGGARAERGAPRPQQGSPERSRRAHRAAQPLGVTPYTLLPPPRARQGQP